MTQEELINKIKEAQKEFFDKNPCKNCVGNGCDDCRHCDEASLRHELSLKLFNLKEEFKKIYNIDYDDYINNQKSQSQNSLNKELLFKDLSARLPYGVKVEHSIQGCYTLLGLTENRVFTSCEKEYYHHDFPLDEDIKPYLFPLSSMTEEQALELEKIDPEFYSLISGNGNIYVSMDIRGYDWLLKNNFDFRGLIPKGLAIDATGLNIY